MNEYRNEHANSEQTGSNTVENRGPYDNLGYHYGEGFVMSDMPGTQGAQRPAESQRTASSQRQAASQHAATQRPASSAQSSPAGDFTGTRRTAGASATQNAAASQRPAAEQRSAAAQRATASQNASASQGSATHNEQRAAYDRSGFSTSSGYTRPTYQAGYDGSYRQTYENTDFRQNYNNRNFSEELNREFGKKSDEKTSAGFNNSTVNGFNSDSGYSTDYDNGAGSTFYNNFAENSGDSFGGNSGNHRKKRFGKAKRTASPVNFTRRGLALLIVLCVVVSAAAGFGGAALGNSMFSNNSTGTVKKASTSASGYKLEDATGANMTVQEITDAAKPSVVEITTESVTSDAWMQQYVTQGAGSGVIITNDGYIMTNNHVIDGANKITVTTSDGNEYEAKLIGADSNNDVAVVKINAKNLTPATYGNSDQLAVGDLAVAIGNPLGELGGTVTAGIISALDRQLAIDGKSMTLLQTDSSINPGNSGGGLFNDDGQLIGIVVAKSSGSDVEGLGFAIPINTAADVAQQIMDKGYVSGQPSTGMTYTEGSGQSGQSGGLDSFFGGSQTSSGVYIYSVEGTNAKKAGFKSGDLVFAVDGTQITSFEDLSSIITSHKVGDKITYTIVRNGQTMDISFKLEEKTGE